jgi:hypothetical protein
LALLSKASPAASSSVSPSSSYSTDAGHPHQLRMATGNQQRDKRKVGGSLDKQRRQQMAFEVMHRNRRLIERHGQRLGKGATDQQGTGQPGPRV